MEIKIEVVENGFVVCEFSGAGVCRKRWSFESAVSLGRFILEWGESNTKVQRNESAEEGVV